MLQCNNFSGSEAKMLVVMIAWLYVALMMAVAEATSGNGTLLGALLTFVLYGAGPVGLVVYLMTAPARRHAARTRELTETGDQQTAASNKPDAGSEPAADAIAPVREKS